MHWNHLHLIVTIHTIEDFVHAFVLTWIKSVTKSGWTVYQRWTGTTHFIEHRILSTVFSRISRMFASPKPCICGSGFVVGMEPLIITTGSDVFRTEIKKSCCATAMTWIALSPLSYCWHASMALSKRFDRSTTISETSNGRFDRSFTSKSMLIFFWVASAAFVLKSASKMGWCVLTRNSRSVCCSVIFQDILQRQNTLDSSSIDLGYSGAPGNRELFPLGRIKFACRSHVFRL